MDFSLNSLFLRPMPLTIATSSVCEILKKDTLVQHRQSEELITPKIMGIGSVSGYVSLLHTFFGFYYPVELSIAAFIKPDILPDIAQRRNSLLIQKDLQALEVSTRVSCAPEIPEIRSIPQALGALYVLEGSTLGGRMIRKMLLSHPHITIPENALQFFNGYGAETGQRWKLVQDTLNRFEKDADEILKSANNTFALFTRWITLTLYHESEN